MTALHGHSEHVERDYFYLCGECGGIAPADSFECLMWDEEGERRIPYDGPDPHLRCPKCDHVHTDDDGDSGIWDGTRLEVQRQRAELLREPNGPWADMWENPSLDSFLAWAGGTEAT